MTTGTEREFSNPYLQLSSTCATGPIATPNISVQAMMLEPSPVLHGMWADFIAQRQETFGSGEGKVYTLCPEPVNGQNCFLTRSGQFFGDFSACALSLPQ
jgi:hypothetical protein